MRKLPRNEQLLDDATVAGANAADNLQLLTLMTMWRGRDFGRRHAQGLSSRQIVVQATTGLVGRMGPDGVLSAPCELAPPPSSWLMGLVMGRDHEILARLQSFEALYPLFLLQEGWRGDSSPTLAVRVQETKLALEGPYLDKFLESFASRRSRHPVIQGDDGSAQEGHGQLPSAGPGVFWPVWDDDVQVLRDSASLWLTLRGIAISESSTLTSRGEEMARDISAMRTPNDVFKYLLSPAVPLPVAAGAVDPGAEGQAVIERLARWRHGLDISRGRLDELCNFRPGQIATDEQRRHVDVGRARQQAHLLGLDMTLRAGHRVVKMDSAAGRNLTTMRDVVEYGLQQQPSVQVVAHFVPLPKLETDLHHRPSVGPRSAEPTTKTAELTSKR